MHSRSIENSAVLVDSLHGVTDAINNFYSKIENISDERYPVTYDSGMRVAQAWELATEIYPDLIDLRIRIASFSEQLASKYAADLLTSKKFHDRHSLANDIQADHLDGLSSENIEVSNYLKYLLGKSAWDAARAWVNYVEVVGVEDLQSIKLRITQDYLLRSIFSKKNNVNNENIRRIESPAVALDAFGRLKESWLGSIYRNYIKPIPIFRTLSIWFWRHGYQIYVNHINSLFFNRRINRWRPLIKLNKFSEEKKISKWKLANGATVSTPKPEIFPLSESGFLVSPHEQYVYPEIFLAEIENAVIYGGSNLVLVDGRVVCHDLYDFKRDYTSEELHGRTLINSKSECIRWLLHDKTPELISEAATFVDSCATNYAHWLTEVLPRIVLFCDEEKFKHVPIVVNDGLHRNIMESLFLVTGTDRKIITLPIGRALKVTRLYCTSVTGYVPFERRSDRFTDHSHGMFSPPAFDKLRTHLVALGERNKDDVWPDKIFLRRNSDIRKVTNAADLEKIAVAKGFIIVEPEKLTFFQQVQLFSNAKIIIGSSGAAMASIVFSSPATKIIVLIGKFQDTSYWYWQNMACTSGQSISYVMGEVKNNDLAGIHADFMIDLDDFSSSMKI